MLIGEILVSSRVERGSEVEPLRPKGETNGSVLDSLKLKEVSRSRDRARGQ